MADRDPWESADVSKDPWETEETYGKKLERELSEKTKKYGEKPSQALKDMASISLPVGIAEQIPAGIQAFGSTVAKGLGGVAGALIPGDTAAAGAERSAQAFNDNTSWLLPKTDSGQAIAGAIGAGAQSLTEKAPQIAEDVINAVPFVGPDLAKDPRVVGGVAAAGSVLPELSMLVPGLGRGGKKVAPREEVKLPEKAKETLEPKLTKEMDPWEQGELFGKPPGELMDMPPRPEPASAAEKAPLQYDLGLESIEPQKAIEERQRLMEEDVKRQATLDYNAAERARREASPTGAEWSPEKVSQAPEVAKTDRFVTRQEEMIIKMAEDVQQGRLSTDHLERAIRDLEASENLLRTTREATEASLKEEALSKKPGTPAFMEKDSRFPPGQRGAVNPEVFKEGFQKLKQLADGTWLRAYNDRNGFQVEARKDGHILGNVTFDSKLEPKSLEKNLEAFSTSVHPDARNKGLATEMYRFASELGNDIKASDVQTQSGRAMWQGFERNGMAQNGYIPKKQRGALLFGDPARKQLEKVLGKQKDYISPDPDIKAALEVAKSEKDSAGGLLGPSKNFESGGVLASLKRGSTAIKAATELIQNAGKRADKEIREKVMPVENAIRDLSVKELKELSAVFKEEMFNRKELTLDELQNRLSIKQLKAYGKMREMFQDTLRVQNEARAARGQKPITELEAYSSSRWDGDFRRPVYDKSGKLVWFLASDSKVGLNAQTRALLRDHPELVYDPKKDFEVRRWNRKTDLESAYTTMLDVLGRDDPSVKKLQEYMEQQTVGRGASFMAQEKHFMDSKANVRGFVGDRPEIKINDLTDKNIPLVGEKSISGGPKSEALGFFQQQINYAKNGMKWAEMQKAGQKLKDIINDPDLVRDQPNNMDYIRDYWKNAIGYGEHRFFRELDNMIRDLGVAPDSFNKGVNGLKTFFILQKLGMSIPYLATQVLQVSMMLPHMADLMAKGYKGNPVSAVLTGILGGPLMTSGHYYNYFSGKNAKMPGTDFMKEAFKYAEDNGITSRSIYDESPIESSFSTVGRAANVFGKTITAVEPLARATAFMTFAKLLKDSGKFKTDAEVFRMAEDRTDAAMVDYRSTEKPLVFAKGGTVGNFLNTLQTYPLNFYNQFNYFGREAGKGNVAPLVAFLGVNYMLAGAMGLPYLDDAHKAWMNIKEMLPAKQWKKLQDSEFWSDPKLFMLKYAGQPSVYGYLSDRSGIGITSRVAAPGMGQMIQSPVGPAADIGKQLMSILGAATDPTNKTKVAQAAMNSSPVGAQGLLETAPFMQGTTWENRPDGHIYVRNSDLADHNGLYVRTPEQEQLRKLGFRTQDEVLARDVTYSIDRATKTAAKKSTDVVKEFYDSVKRGDREDAAEYYKLYADITGKPISKEAFENQIKQNYMTQMERSQTAAKSVQAMLGIKRAMEIFDKIEKDHNGNVPRGPSGSN